MSKDEMLLNLLDALIRSWLLTMTPIEIRSDLERVNLLIGARDEAGMGTPSALVRSVYQEVFLRDIWTREEPGD